MPNSIFISYRRADCLDITGRIHDFLDLHFGPSLVFRDIDRIKSGDFRKQIANALKDSVLALVVIGPQWLTATDETGLRIFNPDDPVYLEVEFALSQDMTIMPLLVGGAKMPREDQLPSTFSGLVRFHALDIRSGREFARDVKELCSQITDETAIIGIDHLQILSDCRKLGLVRAVAHFAEDESRLQEIETCQDLLVVMNDGRSWIGANREILQARLQDPTKRTRFVVLLT